MKCLKCNEEFNMQGKICDKCKILIETRIEIRQSKIKKMKIKIPIFLLIGGWLLYETFSCECSQECMNCMGGMIYAPVAIILLISSFINFGLIIQNNNEIKKLREKYLTNDTNINNENI